MSSSHTLYSILLCGEISNRLLVNRIQAHAKKFNLMQNRKNCFFGSGARNCAASHATESVRRHMPPKDDLPTANRLQPHSQNVYDTAHYQRQACVCYEHQCFSFSLQALIFLLAHATGLDSEIF